MRVHERRLETEGERMSTQHSTIDIDELERLTQARRKAWMEFHSAIGADNAAQAFAKQCREAMNVAARASEDADHALFEFVRAHSEPGPDTSKGGRG